GGPGGKYAYGFSDATAGGVRWLGHGGGAPGMNGDLKFSPDSGYIVSLLANLDPPAPTAIADCIAPRFPSGESAQGRWGTLQRAAVGFSRQSRAGCVGLENRRRTKVRRCTLKRAPQHESPRHQTALF